MSGFTEGRSLPISKDRCIWMIDQPAYGTQRRCSRPRANGRTKLCKTHLKVAKRKAKKK